MNSYLCDNTNFQVEEPDFHGDLRLDPLLQYVTNSLEATKKKIVSELSQGQLGELLSLELINELITNAQYEITLVSHFRLSFTV